MSNQEVQRYIQHVVFHETPVSHSIIRLHHLNKGQKKIFIVGLKHHVGKFVH